MVFCIVGTEKETGGDGAREVSTGVESESVVRRRRAVVTVRLIPLAAGPHFCLPAADSSQTRSRQLLEKAFDQGIFCAKEYYSSITPRLLHVCDSFLPLSDQYSGDPSSSLIQATGHQLVSLCRSVVEEEKN